MSVWLSVWVSVCVSEWLSVGVRRLVSTLFVLFVTAGIGMNFYFSWCCGSGGGG